MNILILGAGAIGCLIGGKLAQNGDSVILVGRPALAQAVHAAGLRIEEAAETQRIDNLGIVVSVAEAFTLAMEMDVAFDLAIITVKSYDTDGVASELAAAVAATGVPAPVILSLQNGVGNEERLVTLVGKDHVIAGSITAPVSVLAPGHIRVDKSDYSISLAAWDKANPPYNLKESVAALERAGIRVHMRPNAQDMKWTKLLMNMMGNALCAILDEPPKEAFTDPRMLNLEIAAWRETLAVMAHTGIRPLNMDPYPLGRLAPLIRHAPKGLLRIALRRIVGGARGSKMPSLHMDLSRGKAHNEVAWLNGAVVRQGRVTGIPTPINALLNDTLLTLASNGEEWEGWRHNHDRLWQTAGLAEL